MIAFDKFLKNIEEEFQIGETKTVLKADTDFKAEENWGSMLALMVIVKITDCYGVILGEQELKQCNTVEDLYNLVLNGMGQMNNQL